MIDPSSSNQSTLGPIADESFPSPSAAHSWIETEDVVNQPGGNCQVEVGVFLAIAQDKAEAKIRIPLYIPGVHGHFIVRDGSAVTANGGKRFIGVYQGEWADD